MGFETKNPHLKAVAESLGNVLRRYTDSCANQDFPWRYSERPLVGMLSAAVWQAGGVTLEEYWTRKRKAGVKSYGRIDLFFKIEDTSYIAEAKHRYINISECSGDWRDLLSSQCKRDAEMNMLSPKECSVGIAFWSVRYKGGTVGIAQTVETLVEEVNKGEDADLTLWHFPAWALTNKVKQGEKHIRYAGLVMQMFITRQAKDRLRKKSQYDCLKTGL